MSGWQRNKAGAVYFYYYQDGVQKKVPRKLTKYLDGQPDDVIELQRHKWGIRNTKPKKEYEVLHDPYILGLVEIFLAYCETRKKDYSTISSHKLYLTKYCLPYFVHTENLRDPHLWPMKSVRMLDHLLKTVKPVTVRRANSCMRVFWKWLVEEGKADGPLLLRNPVREMDDDDTPLSFTVTPEEVLKYNYGRPDLRLLGLIGYFFSLRPQELVSLRPNDFRAGSVAAEYECGKVMKAHKLFDKFAVNITRQRDGKKFKPPKRGSKGAVACFNLAAAKEITTALNGMDRDALIFPFQLDWYIKLWNKQGYQGITLKDLRRASIYWLGHYGVLEFTALKNHARHRDPNTTSLYIRRPQEMNTDKSFQSFDLEA